MTREEIAQYIKSELANENIYHSVEIYLDADDYKVILEALEQEPILDKIRAEIRALSNANPSYWHSNDMVERDDVLEILDKYKADKEKT